jgi:hypothetical protein
MQKGLASRTGFWLVINKEVMHTLLHSHLLRVRGNANTNKQTHDTDTCCQNPLTKCWFYVKLHKFLLDRGMPDAEVCRPDTASEFLLPTIAKSPARPSRVLPAIHPLALELRPNRTMLCNQCRSLANPTNGVLRDFRRLEMRRSVSA